MQTLILASSSPRRKELLEILQLPFEIKSSDVDESFEPGTEPAEVVMELAKRKADAVFQGNKESYVIGADTVVVLGDDILGKPRDEKDAFQMLRSLSGKQHSVFTGVSIVSSQETTTFFTETKVTFWELADDEINAYLQTGEPFDKAGAYGIQGFGSMLVKEIHGDYFAVVGLPVSQTVRKLKQAGFKLPM
ncbi:Maf family protein [Cytobacillus gottheilii]|uniref:Maf family protein n=1 Tax=Cytobacillus gottheilii TaxID=859144 RepID=UPI0009B94A5A|nr:Maf family protein [Cytobacillus gottheilii]